jgi:hypothetical protein
MPRCLSDAFLARARSHSFERVPSGLVELAVPARWAITVVLLEDRETGTTDLAGTNARIFVIEASGHASEACRGAREAIPHANEGAPAC